MKDLEQYFRECDKNRVIDHALRATVSKDKVKFYIHPINANGDTLDYEVKGNALIPLVNGKPIQKATEHSSTLTSDNLEKCFYEASIKGAKYIGVKIKMLQFEDPQVIIDSNINFDKRFSYYKEVFGENLESSQGNKIIGFTYGNSFADIEQDLMGVVVSNELIENAAKAMASKVMDELVRNNKCKSM